MMEIVIAMRMIDSDHDCISDGEVKKMILMRMVVMMVGDDDDDGDDSSDR